MILTTHLMEEAEILSDRIGLIVKGELKCLGTQYKIKREYGGGFKLAICLKESSQLDLHPDINDKLINDVEEFVTDLFNNSKVSEKYKTSIAFEVRIIIK